jgi:hypothetical protein
MVLLIVLFVLCVLDARRLETSDIPEDVYALTGT